MEERNSVFNNIPDLYSKINKTKNLSDYLKEELFQEFYVIGLKKEVEVRQIEKLANNRYEPDIISTYPGRK